MTRLSFGDDAVVRVDRNDGKGVVQIAGPGTNCRVGCLTKDHASWGECLRDAGVRTYLASPSKGLDGTAQKQWDGELEAYRQARKQGIQPDGTKAHQIEAAVRASDAAGAAYGRDFNAAAPMPAGAEAA